MKIFYKEIIKKTEKRLRTIIFILSALLITTFISAQGYNEYKDRLVNRILNSNPNYIDSLITSTIKIYYYVWDDYKITVIKNEFEPYKSRESWLYGLKRHSGSTIIIDKENEWSRLQYNTYERLKYYYKEIK